MLRNNGAVLVNSCEENNALFKNGLSEISQFFILVSDSNQIHTVHSTGPSIRSKAVQSVSGWI